jgi:hypothetical protein
MQNVLEDFFNGLCCEATPPPPVAYNFDVDSSNWAGAGITDQASFELATGTVCSSFVLSGNNIKAVIETGSNINLQAKNITTVNYIKQLNNVSLGPLGIINLNLNPALNINNMDYPFPDTLTSLWVIDCNITEFKTNQQLPIGLRQLNIGFNNESDPLFLPSLETWLTTQNAFYVDPAIYADGLRIWFTNQAIQIVSPSSSLGVLFTAKNVYEGLI